MMQSDCIDPVYTASRKHQSVDIYQKQLWKEFKQDLVYYLTVTTFWSVIAAQVLSGTFSHFVQSSYLVGRPIMRRGIIYMAWGYGITVPIITFQNKNVPIDFNKIIFSRNSQRTPVNP